MNTVLFSWKGKYFPTSSYFSPTQSTIKLSIVFHSDLEDEKETY